MNSVMEHVLILRKMKLNGSTYAKTIHIAVFICKVEFFVVRRAQRVNILFARSIKVIKFVVDYHIYIHAIKRFEGRQIYGEICGDLAYAFDP